MKTVLASARLRSGKLLIRNWTRVMKELSGWKDRELVVTIEAAYATRSEQQNRWYWGCIMHLLSEHTGHTPDELHEYCKLRFNPKPLNICDTNGEIKDAIAIGGSTTKLNKLTFGEYCERIRQWAAEDLGVVIPDPDINWTEAA